MPYAMIVISAASGSDGPEHTVRIEKLLRDCALHTQNDKCSSLRNPYVHVYSLNHELVKFCKLCVLAEEIGVEIQVAYFANEPTFMTFFKEGDLTTGQAILGR